MMITCRHLVKRQTWVMHRIVVPTHSGVRVSHAGRQVHLGVVVYGRDAVPSNRPSAVPLTRRLQEQCKRIGSLTEAATGDEGELIDKSHATVTLRLQGRHMLHIHVDMAHIGADVARFVVHTLHVAADALPPHTASSSFALSPCAYCRGLSIVRHMGIDTSIIDTLEHKLIGNLQQYTVSDVTTLTYVAGYAVIEQSAIVLPWCRRSPHVRAALDRRIAAYATLESPTQRQAQTLDALHKTRNAVYRACTSETPPHGVQLAKGLIGVLMRAPDRSVEIRARGVQATVRLESPYYARVVCNAERTVYMSVSSLFEWMQNVVDAHEDDAQLVLDSDAAVADLNRFCNKNLVSTVVTLALFTAR